MDRWSRREFVAGTIGAGIVTSTGIASDTPRSRPPRRTQKAGKTLALVASTYHYLSHAYHICGRYLDGYRKNGNHHFPDVNLASAYVEQITERDLSRDLAKQHGFRVATTIEDALTLGTGKLAVDGVLLICEHGDYPYNSRGQKLYPRYEYFQAITDVFRKSGRSVPVFCDKHLSYDRHKAKRMVETAEELKFPLMAGSSLPVTWRRPELELPLGTGIESAMLVSRGELEIYGIHALEALQCMLERRFRGPGKTKIGPPPQGVKAVTALQGDAVWKAGDAGEWSWDLLEHALGRSPSRNAGDLRENCMRFQPPATWGFRAKGPIAFKVEYRDGLTAWVLQLDGHVADETFAAQLKDQPKPVSTLFWLPPPPGAAFLEALARHVETFVETGKPPYPIQRTQLTGGILDYALESRYRNGKRLETPDLEMAYFPPEDSGFMRGDYTDPVES